MLLNQMLFNVVSQMVKRGDSEACLDNGWFFISLGVYLLLKYDIVGT